MSSRSKWRRRRAKEDAAKVTEGERQDHGKPSPPPAGGEACSQAWGWASKFRAACPHIVFMAAVLVAWAGLFRTADGELGRTAVADSGLAAPVRDSGDHAAMTVFGVALAEKEPRDLQVPSAATCSAMDTENWCVPCERDSDRQLEDETLSSTAAAVEESTAYAAELGVLESSSRGQLSRRVWPPLQSSPAFEASKSETLITTTGPKTAQVEPVQQVPFDVLLRCPTIFPPVIFGETGTESVCPASQPTGETQAVVRFGDGDQALPIEGESYSAAPPNTAITKTGTPDEDAAPFPPVHKDGPTALATTQTDLAADTYPFRSAVPTLEALFAADAEAQNVNRASSLRQPEDGSAAASPWGFDDKPAAASTQGGIIMALDAGARQTLRLPLPSIQNGPETAAVAAVREDQLPVGALPFCSAPLLREVFAEVETDKVPGELLLQRSDGFPLSKNIRPLFEIYVPDICTEKEGLEIATARPAKTAPVSTADGDLLGVLAVEDGEPLASLSLPLPEGGDGDEKVAEQALTDVCRTSVEAACDWGRCDSVGVERHNRNGDGVGDDTIVDHLQHSAVNDDDDDDDEDTCIALMTPEPALLGHGVGPTCRRDSICRLLPGEDRDVVEDDGGQAAGKVPKDEGAGENPDAIVGRSEQNGSLEILTALQVFPADNFLPHMATCAGDISTENVRSDAATTRAPTTKLMSSCLPVAVEAAPPREDGLVAQVKGEEETTKGDSKSGQLDLKAIGDGDDHDTGLENLVREFNSWTRSIDFPVRKVEAGLVGGGMRLGLVATEPIAQGEPYLSVPGSIVLDASTTRKDPELGPSLARLEASLAPLGLWDEDMESLRILLIAETFLRADRSPWVSYLRLLPTPSELKAYHPLFFDNATIASFEGSGVQAPLRQRRDSEVADFATKFIAAGSAGRELQDVLGVGWITLERYLWATAIVESRCIWWGGRKHLVPLLDLVNNAQNGPLTSIHETRQDREGNAVTAAARNFAKGEQVMEDYGHPNHVLLLHHGFSLGRENSHDCVRIDARRPIRPGAKYQETLDRLQAAFPTGRPVFCLSLRGNGSSDFVPYVRIMAGLPFVPEQQRHQQQQQHGFPNGCMYDRSIDSCSASLVSIYKGHDEEVPGRSCSPVKSPVDGDEDPRAPMSNPENISPGPAPSDESRCCIHEQWKSLHNDPEGLRAVINAVERRLSGYPRFPLRLAGGGDDGTATEESVGTAAFDHGHDDAPRSTIAGEATRAFLDSERNLLRELYDYLVAFLPSDDVDVPPVPREHGGGRAETNDSSSKRLPTGASVDFNHGV